MADLDRFCAFAERFLTDERGRPLVIEGFQREVLADYFGGAGSIVEFSRHGVAVREKTAKLLA